MRLSGVSTACDGTTALLGSSDVHDDLAVRFLLSVHLPFPLSFRVRSELPSSRLCSIVVPPELGQAG